MPNIEIKASYADLGKARQIAERCKTKYIGILHQIDTYFCTNDGRLKLREIPSQGAWLIPYMKTYEDRPARSDYQLLPVANPEATKDLFSKLMGIHFVVDKKREVFLIDNVRVHLDDVKGLGQFLEFEAVFDEDTQEVRSRETRKIEGLMLTFGITKDDLVTQGYVDLLSATEATQ